MIKLYSKNNCGACTAVKMIFEGKGLVEGEDFNYINTDLPENKEHQAYIYANYSSFPVVEYKDIRFTGVEMDKIDQIVNEVRNE